MRPALSVDLSAVPVLRRISGSNRRLFVLCVAATAVLALAAVFFIDAADADGLKVFGSYWASGWAASHGLDPYAAQPHTWIYEIGGQRIVDLNLNPPVLLPLFAALAKFDVVAMARLWMAMSCILFYIVAAVLLARSAPPPQRRQIVWLFAAPAFFDTVSLGQIYIGLFALAAIAWLAFENGRPILAGLAIGALVAVKPTFGLWPVFLLLAGHRRPALAALLTAAILSAIPIGLYGPKMYVDWWRALAADQHSMIPTDASLQGYFGRLGLKPVGQVLAAALLVFSGLWIYRRRFEALDVSRIALAVTILAAPLSWVHYTLLLAPALLGRRWSRTMNTAAVMLCVPVLVPLQATGGPGPAMAVLSSVYVVAVVLILTDFVRDLMPARRLVFGRLSPHPAS